MTVSRPPRAPRPKPLALTLLVVALLGGSCTMQQLSASSAEAPSKEELAKVLNLDSLPSTGKVEPAVRAAKTEQLLDLWHAMVVRELEIDRALRPYTVGFGLLLVLAYAFGAVFAMRAASLRPDAPRALSIAALVILPARVAFAAIETVAAKSLRPAMDKALGAAAELSVDKLPPDQAEILGRALGQAALWIQYVPPLFVCLLFFYAWRYFQRPEVRQVFEQQARPTG